MFHIRRRRTRIRLISYISAALLAAVVYGIYTSWLAYTYRRSIEYSYQRSLSELSDHVGNIHLGLQKGMYVGTSPQLAGISAQIWREAGAAKSNLSEIPIYRSHLDNTYKFISQVGDYANSLTKEAALNRKISDGDRKKMQSLSTFADKLSTQISKMIDDMYNGRLSIFTANDALKSGAVGVSSSAAGIDTGLQDVENNLSSLPSLIYNGPFSDNVLKRESAFTKGKPTVSRERARKTAAALLGAAESALKDAGETAGRLPAYNFTSGTAAVAVAKAGGYPLRMMDSRAVSSADFNSAAALQKAEDFLSRQGIKNMKESYYQTGNNVCVINFAYRQGQTVCYPDLIKVGIALDNGDVVSFDATGYLMNHRARTLPSTKVALSSVEKQVSPLVSVESAGLCVIPMEDATESYCYEVRCRSKNGQQILDYYDTQTGREQQLLMLLESADGVLAH